MKAIITVGIPASGKTTFANEMVQNFGFRDINRDFIRFNLVKPGSNWSTYKFNKANEKAVDEIHGKMIMESWQNEQNIIISDTNLNKARRRALIARLQDLGYDVEVKPFEISRKEAIKRDNLRANGVGQDVIYKMMQNWNEFSGRVTYTPNEELPKAVIFDVDGTIATMDGRGPFEWHRVGEDLPREMIIKMLRGYADLGFHIIICSGRSDECFKETATWLDKYVGLNYWDKLYMRKAGDFRKDDSIKEEIFWTKIAYSYNVCGVVDDRSQMIRLWWELKIPNVICVGNPYFEF